MLQKLCLTILLTLLLIGTNLAQQPLTEFIDIHKNQEKAVCMTLPGWLLRSGFNFAENFAEEQDQKAYLGLGKYLEKLRFLVIDDNAEINETALNNLIADLPDHGMESFASIRDEENTINVWIRENDKIVRNLAILIHGADQLLVVNIEADLPLDTFKSANFSFNNQLSKNN